MASFVLLSLFLLFVSIAKTSLGVQLPSAISDHLRASGYSISASILSASILSASTHHQRHRHVNFHKGWNTTGTLFLPSDSAFHSHSKSLNRHHLDPSQFSVSLLLYHVIPSPPLRWSNLISLPSHSTIPLSISIPTFGFRRNQRSCLFLHRPQPSSAYLCVKNSPLYGVEDDEDSCVSIIHPDLYTSRDLVIHGVDGILDHSSAFPCFRRRKRGPHGHLRRAKLSDVTFPPSNGLFRRKYDDDDNLRHRRRRSVATKRYRLLDLSKLPRGTRIGTTTGRNSTVRIGGDLTVDGEEIFGNGWAVVLSIKDILPVSDDVADQVSDVLDYSDVLAMEGPSDGSDYQIGGVSEPTADVPQVPSDVDADMEYRFP